MDATAAMECAGSSGETVAGVKDGVPVQQQVVVRKDKVLRARPMRPKKTAWEGQSSEPVLCSEGVNPLYALSVHAVSGSVCVCSCLCLCVNVCMISLIFYIRGGSLSEREGRKGRAEKRRRRRQGGWRSGWCRRKGKRKGMSGSCLACGQDCCHECQG